ncbi:structural maintenance of chromosomes protein 2-like [Nannospalax galili]|uniref:structural maintenance of chromosomes protein 2-like n=1 Tax=Nannospalax galili TaxID=1026970 RepID=UPI00111C88F6|nr:structural maintenance of chromosomes protein 2-like [Nannospalax galili]
MHIKSIILEGFKSYAQRTEVNGFDPLFNAITGLNGSGKSNILDSICFLLGISNLSQGRITKVLNMKPPEILSMIEEAAGTRMYEYKKIAAQKTIEKKEAKLKEIKTILEEEITPTIQKLKEERSSYLEYQKVMREIEHLSRLYIAYQFLLAEDTKERSAEELKEMQDKILKLQEELSENDKKIKALNREIEEFIVVSLKEGMFNNANVLFKTKFVDGVSTVARFTQSQNGRIPKEAKSKAKGPK